MSLSGNPARGCSRAPKETRRPRSRSMAIRPAPRLLRAGEDTDLARPDCPLLCRKPGTCHSRLVSCWRSDGSSWGRVLDAHFHGPPRRQGRDRRGHRRGASEGPRDPGPVWRPLHDLLVRPVARHHLLPGRRTGQGSGGVRAPRSARPHRRRSGGGPARRGRSLPRPHPGPGAAARPGARASWMPATAPSCSPTSSARPR